ncbi:MAG TPA: glycosyltransferase family 2 protein [Vicinamibacterales bacterium]|nr:glycosyltransferase family 2 protein [Vicinamibacterales bacterium]
MISVLIPVYNNERTLEELCARLAASLHAEEYEVLLVNDGSRDRSWSLLSKLAALNPRVKVIGLSRNFGQHPAIAAALDRASGDVLVLMDADLEDQPENVLQLVSALESNGCDIVYTVKEGADDSPRDLTSTFYHHVFSRITGVSVPHRLGTFRAFTRKVLLALREFPERHVLYGPLMFYVGFRYVIVTVSRGTRVGRSSYSFGKRLRLALNSLVTYTDLPPKAFAAVGLGMVALTSVYAMVVLAQYFVVGQRLPRGLTIIVLLLSGMTGMLMVAIGTLGVYIFRIFQEVLARPRYLVDETLNLGAAETHGRPGR